MICTYIYVDSLKNYFDEQEKNTDYKRVYGFQKTGVGFDSYDDFEKEAEFLFVEIEDGRSLVHKIGLCRAYYDVLKKDGYLKYRKDIENLNLDYEAAINDFVNGRLTDGKTFRNIFELILMCEPIFDNGKYIDLSLARGYWGAGFGKLKKGERK